MDGINHLEGELFALTYLAVMISIILTGIWVFFTNEGKQFRKAKKNGETIGEYISKLRKTALILAGVVAPTFILLGLLAHFM